MQFSTSGNTCRNEAHVRDVADFLFYFNQINSAHMVFWRSQSCISLNPLVSGASWRLRLIRNVTCNSPGSNLAGSFCCVSFQVNSFYLCSRKSQFASKSFTVRKASYDILHAYPSLSFSSLFLSLSNTSYQIKQAQKPPKHLKRKLFLFICFVVKCTKHLFCGFRPHISFNRAQVRLSRAINRLGDTLIYKVKALKTETPKKQ